MISTSVAHAAATLLQTSVQLLIVHDSARISPSQVAMLRARAEGGALPCVVLGSTSSRLVDADTRVLQTPVETDSVMQAIKAALGLSRGPRRTPTHSRTRRVSSFSIPKARGEFSMPSEPARPQRRSDAPGPDARHGYSVQSRARKTLRLMPAVSNSMNRL